METKDLAKILALTRLKSKATQPERVRRLLDEGIDSAIDFVLDNQLDVLSPAEDAIRVARADIRAWAERGINIISILDDKYPENLRMVHEAPALIFTQGILDPGDVGVAVVGSRSASEKALQAADYVAGLLVEEQLTVVSGLAKGIDAAAHSAALKYGGRTVAVVGTGLDRTYPAENVELRHRIESSGGLVLTQFEPGAVTTRASFPMRNITMSGYSFATVIVTAGEKSGTRQQARRALLHGRNVILLAPVVRETKWGRAMATQPGVFVVEDIRELNRALWKIKQNRRLLDALI